MVFFVQREHNMPIIESGFADLLRLVLLLVLPLAVAWLAGRRGR